MVARTNTRTVPRHSFGCPWTKLRPESQCRCRRLATVRCANYRSKEPRVLAEPWTVLQRTVSHPVPAGNSLIASHGAHTHHSRSERPCASSLIPSMIHLPPDRVPLWRSSPSGPAEHESVTALLAVLLCRAGPLDSVGPPTGMINPQETAAIRLLIHSGPDPVLYPAVASGGLDDSG